MATDEACWSPANMTEKLAAWRQDKQRGGGKGEMHNRRPLTEQRKMTTGDFSASKPRPGSTRRGRGGHGGHDENSAARPNSNSGSSKSFGWKKKPTPSKISKRKVEQDGQRVLTPVQKKSCTPTSRKGSSVTVADVMAKLEPWTQRAKALVDKKVCKDLRKHELVKRVKRLQTHVLDTRKSYSEYIGQVNALLELCLERERALQEDTAEHAEENDALRAAREDLEHTIYTLKEEQKTHVRNITDMIDAKKAMKEENMGLAAKTNVLADKLKEAAAGDAKAQAEITALQTDLDRTRADYESLAKELAGAKKEFAAETARVRTEQEALRRQAEEAMDATVREVKGQLSAESTQCKVLEAQRAGLEEQVRKLELSNTEVRKAKDELQAKVTELTLSDVRQVTQIEGLQSSVEHLKSALEQKEALHNKNMEHFEKMLTQNEHRTKRSDSEKDHLNDQLCALQATHGALEAASRKLETQCATLETQLADATARGDASAAELATSLEQLEKQQDKLTTLEEAHSKVLREFEAAQAKFAESKLAWEDSQSMLTAQVAEGKTAVEKLQATLKTAEHALVSKEAQLETTEKQLTKLEKKVEAFETNSSEDYKQTIAKMAEMIHTRDEMSKQLTNQDTIVRDYENSQAEVARLRTLLLDSETARRKLHNRVQELRGNIRVFVRVRPFLASDGAEYDSKQASLRCLADGQSVHVGDKTDHKFSFDRVFRRGSTQAAVFEEVSELVQSALDGYNVCIFSYGQTGSGKTYTMQGFPTDPEQRGLIPRSMEQILETSRRMQEQGWEFQFQASFVEIYNEQVRDLLRTSEAGANCDIKRNAKGKTYVDGAERMGMENMSDVGRIMRVAQSKRAVGCTAMNSVSSRSHSVFTIFITGTCAAHGKKIRGALNLCDLAGSERLARSQAEGAALKETQAINKSLSALANVFMSLKAKSSHIPYRNSKLTYMLENCFSKDGKTMMLVNVSPTLLSQHETTCSLRFAAQVNQTELGRAKAEVSDIRSGGASKVSKSKATPRSISKVKRTRK